jgi:hypothetical protein
LTTALPLLLATAQAIPTEHLEDKRQIKVLAGAPISNISVKADNLVQCAKSTISWSGAVVRMISFILSIVFQLSTRI